jgi:hypothetical protein
MQGLASKVQETSLLQLASSDVRGLFLADADALATAASSFARLLAPFDARLHVVATALELAEDPFRCHLALEMLDCPLDALVADLDLEGLAQY